VAVYAVLTHRPRWGSADATSELALAVLLAGLLNFAILGGAAPARGTEPAKVAIIVGPVGAELTPVYLSLADAAAEAAQTRGATVATAYSPDATAEKVLAAVEGASIVVYFGHGIGTPNPYSDEANPASVNGWGLNGPRPNGHADSVGDGSLAYYGEAWIAEHAKPSPGWVMIYSNACYAPGAGEGQHEPADEATAAERVAAYSRAPLTRLGASAYFATDFYEGAAQLIGTLLDTPELPYGDVFAADPHFIADGLTRFDHPEISGAETWLHRSAYFAGKTDYWYAFAGDPELSLSGSAGVSLAALAATQQPWVPGAGVPADGSLIGRAAAYAHTPGHDGQATVALPAELAAALPDGETSVLVCADRCARLPVVASLATSRSRSAVGAVPAPAIALSQAAWLAVSDAPLGSGPTLVRIRLHPGPALPAPEVTEPLPSATPSPLPLPAELAPPPPPPAPTAPPTEPPASEVPSQTPAPSPSPSREPTPTPSPTPGASASPTVAPSAAP
jgi:hypothetical protein